MAYRLETRHSPKQMNVKPAPSDATNAQTRRNKDHITLRLGQEVAAIVMYIDKETSILNSTWSIPIRGYTQERLRQRLDVSAETPLAARDSVYLDESRFSTRIVIALASRPYAWQRGICTLAAIRALA